MGSFINSKSVPTYLLRLRVGPLGVFMPFVKMFEENTHFANRGSTDKVKHENLFGPFISITLKTIKKKKNISYVETLCLGSLNLMLKEFAGDLAYGNSRINTSN